MFQISRRVPFARLQVYSRLYFPLDTFILRLGFPKRVVIIFQGCWTEPLVRANLLFVYVHSGAERTSFSESTVQFVEGLEKNNTITRTAKGAQACSKSFGRTEHNGNMFFGVS